MKLKEFFKKLKHLDFDCLLSASGKRYKELQEKVKKDNFQMHQNFKNLKTKCRREGIELKLYTRNMIELTKLPKLVIRDAINSPAYDPTYHIEMAENEFIKLFFIKNDLQLGHEMGFRNFVFSKTEKVLFDYVRSEFKKVKK